MLVSSPVVNLDELDGFELAAGIRAKPLFGDGAMLNLLVFEPRARVERHAHPHEQLGLVLAGVLHLEIEGVAHELRPGDAYQIPGGVEHAAWTTAEGCRVVDVFQPVREDLRERFAASAP
jgi:quercetin dioxygenase-like cupin family protein